MLNQAGIECTQIQTRFPSRDSTQKSSSMILAVVLFTVLAVLEQAKSNGDTNIARGGRVTQSSLSNGGAPERAIDGNRAAHWSQGSCTQTTADESPWWRLDLLRTYKISAVTITNRGDCCHDRLNGAEIHIGDSLNNNGNSNARCAVITTIQAGASQTFVCSRMDGRYINIVIPRRREILTLCEVEVTGEPADDNVPAVINIARGGMAAQSSPWGNVSPDRAIDGNRNSIFSQNSCTHTQGEKRPWWRLDLFRSHKINTIIITNRGDCCAHRINDAEIRIGDSLDDNGNANPRCAVISAIPAGISKTFVCQGMEGRYINIVIPRRVEYLTLCEVEVYGEPSDGTSPVVINVARGGITAQSSPWGNAFPDRAIDGNQESIWYYDSCTHTQNDEGPWWRLDLLKTFTVYKVVITNRRDCCESRLNGAEIHIGDSLDDNGNANPRCAVITYIPAGGSQSFVCDGMVGRYVNIVIPGRREYLTLCEVEVYGLPLDGTTPAATNIARLGSAEQSSVFDVGYPRNAIDGNLANRWEQRSCTHTMNDIKPWWRLDLLKTYKVNKVIITNRGDAVSERINGSEIRIGDSLDDNGNANPRCTVITTIPAGVSQTFFCKGMEGRYVNIVIPGRQEYLTLCEVEVFGEEGDDFIEDVCQ